MNNREGLLPVSKSYIMRISVQMREGLLNFFLLNTHLLNSLGCTLYLYKVALQAHVQIEIF